MALNKKLIHFKKYENFIGENGLDVKNHPSQTQPDANDLWGNIPDKSIVFIQDTKQIWTHGTFYNGVQVYETIDEATPHLGVDLLSGVVYILDISLIYGVNHNAHGEYSLVSIDYYTKEEIDDYELELLDSDEPYTITEVTHQYLATLFTGDSITVTISPSSALFLLKDESDNVLLDFANLSQTLHSDESQVGIYTATSCTSVYLYLPEIEEGTSFDVTASVRRANGITTIALTQEILNLSSKLKNFDILIFTFALRLPTTPTEDMLNKIVVTPSVAVTDSITPPTSTIKRDPTNIYSEYIWIDDKWEKLGEFKANVDLSNYYTKVETNTAILNSVKTISDITVKGVEIGGYSDGDVIEAGTAFESILKSMLLKLIHASILLNPSVVLNIENGPTEYTTYDVGKSFSNVKLTCTFNDGYFLNGDGSTTLAGCSIKLANTDWSNPDEVSNLIVYETTATESGVNQSDDGTEYTITKLTLPEGNSTISVIVEHTASINIPKDNMGNDDTSISISASEKSNTKTFKARYRYYYGGTTADSPSDITSTTGLTSGWITPNDTTTIKKSTDKYTLPLSYFVVLCQQKYKLATIQDYTSGTSYLPNFTIGTTIIDGVTYNVYLWKKSKTTPDVKNITLNVK